VPILERSRELADEAADKHTASEALRHLGVAGHRAGHLAAARERLEESSRLRREIGQLPGVAANLVGLAYIAAADHRPDDARALLAEAAAIAQSHGADRITRQVDEARARLQDVIVCCSGAVCCSGRGVPLRRTMTQQHAIVVRSARASRFWWLRDARGGGRRRSYWACWVARRGAPALPATGSDAAISSIVARVVSGKLIRRPCSWPAIASSIR
jgi:hypothetical protein